MGGFVGELWEPVCRMGNRSKVQFQSDTVLRRLELRSHRGLLRTGRPVYEGRR